MTTRKPTPRSTRPRLLAVIAATLLIIPGVPMATRAAAAASWTDQRAESGMSTLPIWNWLDGTAEGFTPGATDPTDCLTQADPYAWTGWTSFELTATTTLEFAIDYVWSGALGGIYPAGDATAVVCINTLSAPTRQMVTLPAGRYDVFAASTTSWQPVIVDVQEVPMPDNDNLAGARPLDVPTYDQPYDLRLATLEDGEPDPCRNENGMSGSVWYSFTAPPSGHVQIHSSWSGIGFALFTTSATGPSTFADLTPASGCAVQSLTTAVQPGRLYLLQVTSTPSQWLTSTFTLQEAPPLTVHVNVTPSDPNTYDTVEIYVWGENEPLSTCAVDFGDGQSASNPACTWGTFTYRYAQDGTYTVTATGTTADGRQDTATTTTKVVTHDVAVTGIAAPRTASVGKPSRISVTVSTTRYPETVRVTLNATSASGPAEIGSVTATLPAGKRSQTLTFTYTPSPSDADQGAVTLTANVSIIGGGAPVRDADPTNNTASTAPIRIRQ